jgi:hypothetical protein
MPWTGSARFAFDTLSILANAPAASGVYAILSQESWIYVGESGTIRGGLLARSACADPCVTRNAPTHFMYDLSPYEDRWVRREELIQEFQPVCNEPEFFTTGE